MKYLLDTCTIFELTREKPRENVVSWFESIDENRLFLSVVSLGEIEKGIYGLEQGKKRTRLEKWFYDEVVPGFSHRILEIEQRTMSTWAKLNADLNKQGIVRPAFDSLFEATAVEHDLVLVTRNIKNFQNSAATILNPWDT
ncbi:MAG: type II toxin-antitoxin system VapC family toxin [Blastocatellia bacterium]|nr:type II toxin-antitoxin system VapC family toxin [Blastocatellia bacterium]